MRGVSEYIRIHEKTLKEAVFTDDFLAFHLTQVRFLQHERFIHLLVMLFTFLAVVIFFLLFLVYQTLPMFSLLFIGLILAVFYIFHYFKLENTVIKWYYIYNAHKQNPGQHEYR